MSIKYDVAKNKGLEIIEENNGFAVYQDKTQIRFAFDEGKANDFIDSFDPEEHKKLKQTKQDYSKTEIAQNPPMQSYTSKKKVNKVVRIALMGGLIGAITTNPRKALEDRINQLNKEGWNAIHIDPHSTTNLFIWLLQLLLLILTLGLFTWGGGYLVLLEKEEI